MNIAVLMSWLPGEGNWGGVGYQAHRLCNHLVRRNHKVDVYTASHRPPEAIYNTVRLATDAEASSRWFMTYLLALRYARVDYNRYDVVHAHGDNQWLRTRTPVVRTFHGSALGEALTSGSWRRRITQLTLYPTEWIACARATERVAVSENTRRYVPGIRCVIPNGVDLAEFRPGKKSEAPSILFVGHLRGRKRGGFLLGIFAQQVRPAVPDAELWMVSDPGVPCEGVRWYGRPDTEVLADLYRKAWVFCLPSIYEGFGIPYIEAMASGTCVAASPNPGAIEVLDRGNYGVIARDSDLGDALITLLTDSEKRKELAERGIRRAGEYCFDRVVEQYEALFRLVAEKHSSS